MHRRSRPCCTVARMQARWDGIRGTSFKQAPPRIPLRFIRATRLDDYLVFGSHRCNPRFPDNILHVITPGIAHVRQDAGKPGVIQ